MLEVNKIPGNSAEGAKKWLADPENRKVVDSWFS
jgi:hypothetical protein